MNQKKFRVKIKTSIVVVFSAIVLFIVGTMVIFQYKSSHEFAILTTQKIFDRVSDQVVNKIQTYDTQSVDFIKLVRIVDNSDNLPDITKEHTLLPIITQYIKRANYVYGIYIGYKNDSFYIVYNLDLSPKMREVQGATKEARWLIKKNIVTKNGKFISYKEFVDKDFNIISTTKEPTSFLSTQRPWYKEAIKTNNIIKTKPYIFSALKVPGVTYAQKIDTNNGTVLALDITLNSLSKLLASQNLVKGSAAFIFKSDGTVIGQLDQISNKKIKNLNDQYPDSFIKNGKVVDLDKQTIVTIKGKEYLKYTTMLKSNFTSKDYFTILSPIEVIMEPYTKKVYQTIAVTLLTLFFIILPILFYTIRLIVKPILQLQKENQKVKDGKFEEVKHIESFMIEIVSLSDSLVSMSNAIEESHKNLETKIEERTKDLKLIKEDVEQILANILLPVLITEKSTKKVIYANKYAKTQYELPLDKIIGSHLDDIYTIKGNNQSIIDSISLHGFISNIEEELVTSQGKEFTALLSVTPIHYKNKEAYIGMVTDISKQKKMENEIRAIHKQTRDSIEYASLIQRSLIPQNGVMTPYFKDHFVMWKPKDTVGGDIWLFDDLRDEDECLLMFIDCTGHGVPGAFVTMIVKAVEREIISLIKSNPTMDVSPAWVMQYFNKTIKKLLRQESKESLSNAGWDGGIIYYNKKDKILKFAGAETPLFYITKDGEFKTIKGNRYSVGYKKCDANYEYKESIIEVEEGMKFYCTTDGYLDQNGGEKDFPFGKKRFGNIIKEFHTKPMNELQSILEAEMCRYESVIPNNDRNDDMTVIGFQIG